MAFPKGGCGWLGLKDTSRCDSGEHKWALQPEEDLLSLPCPGRAGVGAPKGSRESGPKSGSALTGPAPDPSLNLGSALNGTSLLAEQRGLDPLSGG